MESGAVHPLALLTRDGWIHVLARLDKPKDCWNAAHVHPLFLAIFQTDFREKWITAMFYSCVPQLLNFIPFAKVLELRLVDREIRSSIDQCLEQGQVSELKNYKNKVRLLNTFNPFLDEYGLGFHNITLPITRWMNLELSFDDDLDRFEDFLPFFRQYGPQFFKVTGLPFYYDERPERVLQQLSLFRNLLIAFPNLEVLVLDGYNEESIKEKDVVPHRCSADLLTGFLRDNPLPPLPCLHGLKLDLIKWPQCEISVVARAIWQCYGVQLCSLQSSTTSLILPQRMCRLRKLFLWLESSEQLASLQASGAPLEVLTVNIAGTSPILPSQFFLALQPFQSTLKTLRLIYLTWSWRFKKFDQVPVKFPFVEILKLEGYIEDLAGKRLGFLDSFPNLKELELRIVQFHVAHLVTVSDRSDDSDEEEDEDFSEDYWKYLEEKYFYKASIWTRLLNLQQVKIRVSPNISRTFSRKAWSTTFSCPPLSESRKVVKSTCSCQ